jgi:hypothetical protein
MKIVGWEYGGSGRIIYEIVDFRCKERACKKGYLGVIWK